MVRFATPSLCALSCGTQALVVKVAARDFNSSTRETVAELHYHTQQTTRQERESHLSHGRLTTLIDAMSPRSIGVYSGMLVRIM